MPDEENAARDPLWVARQKVSLDELTAADGALWWLQGWPQDGTTRLVRQAGHDVPSPVTPQGFSVGGWLHGYGGGSYAVHGGTCWVISGEDSGLYQLDTVTGALDLVLAGDGFLYGDLHVCPLGVLAVRGSEDGDELILVDCNGKQAQTLVKSAGFLAAPCFRAGRVAFLEWDADQMPWDGSRLHAASLTADGSVTQAQTFAAGTAESVVQPAWGPDGNLYYMSDRSGWWNLRRWDGRHDEAVTRLEYDCAPAPWEAGYRSFAFLVQPSEAPLQRKAEDRADQLIVDLYEIDGGAVAPAGIDNPVLEVAAVENIVDRDSSGHPENILVLHREAGDPRQVELAIDFGQIIVVRVVPVLDVRAPGELCPGNIVPQREIAPAVFNSADRPRLAG